MLGFFLGGGGLWWDTFDYAPRYIRIKGTEATLEGVGRVGFGVGMLQTTRNGQSICLVIQSIRKKNNHKGEKTNNKI